MQFFILKIIFDVFPLENLLFVTNVKNHHFVTYISLNFEGEGENGRTSDEKNAIWSRWLCCWEQKKDDWKEVFEPGIIMKRAKQKGEISCCSKVALGCCLLHHRWRVSTQQGVPKDFYLPPSSSFAWCSNSTTYLVVVTNQTWAILRDFFFM